jgi:arginine-tRNA-protein transferase
VERKVVTEITGPDADGLHERLSRAGFRRSHNIAYAPVCQNCSACVPIRIPVRDYVPNGAMRRVLKRNQTTVARDMPAHATAEHFALFQAYQQTRHGEGDMAAMSFYDYRAMVEDTPVETRMVEFRDGAEKLLGVCLIDKMGDGISAVYSFFDTTRADLSLGTLAILWLVSHAKALGLPYVYLGYWVAESRKMAYKARFRPSEILAGGTWRPLTDADLAVDAERMGTLVVPETVE